MVSLTTPQVVLFGKDIARMADFYTAVAFEEVFRTSATGPRIRGSLDS